MGTISQPIGFRTREFARGIFDYALGGGVGVGSATGGVAGAGSLTGAGAAAVGGVTGLAAGLARRDGATLARRFWRRIADVPSDFFLDAGRAVFLATCLAVFFARVAVGIRILLSQNEWRMDDRDERDGVCWFALVLTSL